MVVGITGASGFIGSALVRRYLQAGHVVRALTRQPGRGLQPGVQPFEGDLEQSDDRLVRFADGLDILYHCAGELIDERRMEAVNVGGVRTLLRAAEGRVGRWVQLSSAGVYGRRRSGIISEHTALDPRGLYERTKAEADTLVQDAARRDTLPCTVLRPSIVFGREMPNASVRQMIGVIERGLFFFIGARGASANYVHVDNVVDALVACGEWPHAAGRVYNLSDWCTVEDFAAAIADALGRPRPRLRLPEPAVRCAARVAGRIAAFPLTESRVDALVSRSRYSIQRIQQDLHYVPRVTIPDGLAQMVAEGRAA